MASQGKDNTRAVVTMFANELDEILTAVALQTLEYATQNIQDDNLVDTTFLRESGYVVPAGKASDLGHGYGSISPSGVYDGAQSENKQKIAAPAAKVRKHEAVAGFAASYAISHEARHKFLYKGLEQACNEFKKLVRGVDE